MNENLKGVKKNNVRFYVYRVDGRDDYESLTRKGYVNWPFAIQAGTTSLDHLPTSLKAYSVLVHPRNFTDAKKHLDWMLPQLIEAAQKVNADLETEEGIVSIKDLYFSLCQAKMPEEDTEPGNDFVTCEYGMITGFAAIRRNFTKEGTFLIFDFPDQQVKIDKKTFNSFLTSLGSSAIIKFNEVVDKELVTEKLNSYKYANYRLEVVRKEVQKCLKVEYQVGGINGTAHFPEVK
jgi:hypothetical protein